MYLRSTPSLWNPAFSSTLCDDRAFSTSVTASSRYSAGRHPPDHLRNITQQFWQNAHGRSPEPTSRENL
jgi:hypothetical protein